MNDYFPCEMSEAEAKLPTLAEIESIFSRIGGERSKKIFEDRLLYSFSRDERYLWDMISSNEKTSEFVNIVQSGAYIYGAGIRGQRLKKVFENVNWIGFIDKNKRGLVENLPVYNLDTLSNIIKSDYVIVISIKDGIYQAVNDLISAGISKSRIVLLEDYICSWFGSIYFDERCLEGISRNDGVFLDLGCYDGADSLNALRFFSGTNVTVHAFEPDPQLAQICKTNLAKKRNKIKIFQKAISSKQGTHNFKEDGEGSRIDDEGGICVNVTTIDEHLGDTPVCFIKMDIEGAEENALIGGRQSIQRDKPILAMSVYHKRSDIWRLPLRVLEINPDYRLEFEHHLFSWGDTVMYAIPN